MPHQQSQMQADAQPGIFLRQRHGFGEAGFVHHQAGAGQNAFAMRADDGLVDGRRTAEIVRIDDEAADRGLRIARLRHCGIGVQGGP